MQFYEIAIGRISCDSRTVILTGSAGFGSGAVNRGSGNHINGLTARWNFELGDEITGIS